MKKYNIAKNILLLLLVITMCYIPVYLCYISERQKEINANHQHRCILY